MVSISRFGFPKESTTTFALYSVRGILVILFVLIYSFSKSFVYVQTISYLYLVIQVTNQ